MPQYTKRYGLLRGLIKTLKQVNFNNFSLPRTNGIRVELLQLWCLDQDITSRSHEISPTVPPLLLGLIPLSMAPSLVTMSGDIPEVKACREGRGCTVNEGFLEHIVATENHDCVCWATSWYFWSSSDNFGFGCVDTFYHKTRLLLNLLAVEFTVSDILTLLATVSQRWNKALAGQNMALKSIWKTRTRFDLV